MLGSVQVHIDFEPPKEIQDWVTENEERVALKVRDTAKKLSPQKGGFLDYKGTSRESNWSRQHNNPNMKLRKKTGKRKSKFDEGGFIVMAQAPHAWLVEHGHDIVDWRTMKSTGKRAKPHPFLKTALTMTLSDARRIFGIT